MDISEWDGMGTARARRTQHSAAWRGHGFGTIPCAMAWCNGCWYFYRRALFCWIGMECRNARRQPGDGQAGQARHGMGSSQKRLGGGSAPNSQPDEKTPEPSMGGP